MSSNDSEHDVFWSTVHRTLENLRANAPEGFSGRIQVFIGDETIEPAGVGRLGSWVYFEIDEDDAEVVSEARRVLFTRPDYISRVEVNYEREGRDIGFRVDEPKVAGIERGE